MSEIVGKIGPLRYRMGHECGDIFEVDDDYDGLTLTVEVRDEAEGRRLIEALRDLALFAEPSINDGLPMNGSTMAAARRAIDALSAATNTSARRAGFFD